MSPEGGESVAQEGKHSRPEPRPELTGRSAVKNASFVAIAQCIGKLSTLVWTVVAAQQLGQAGFGVFNFAIALGLIIVALGQWGFDIVMVRRASKNVDQLSRYFSEAIVWQVGLSAPLLIIGAVVYGGGSPDDRGAALATVMILGAVLADLISDNARAASSTIHRQGITSLALIGQRIVMAAISIPLMLLWGNVMVLGAAFLFSSLAGLVLHAVALRRLEIRFSLRLVSWSGLRECFGGTGAIGLSSLIQVLQARIGFVLLGVWATQEVIGSYSAAFRLYETVLFLAFALDAAIFPLMSIAERGKGLRKLVEASISILIGFYLPFAVVCILDAPGLVRLVFGEDYVAGASWALFWLAAAPLLFGIGFMSRAALLAASSTKPVLVVALLSTGTVTLLCVLLVPQYQAAGATIALTGGLAVDAIFSVVFLSAILDRWPQLLRQAVLPALCCIPVMGIFVLLPAPFLARLVLGAVIYIVCWGSALYWGRSSAGQLVRSIPGGTAADSVQNLDEEAS